jgi:hypothetical protein
MLGMDELVEIRIWATGRLYLLKLLLLKLFVLNEPLKPLPPSRRPARKALSRWRTISQNQMAEKDDVHPFPGRIKGAREIDHGCPFSPLADRPDSPSSNYIV